MLVEMTDVLEGLRVFPDRMRANLDVGGGLVYSQSVLLAMIDAGMSRDDAYRIVQAAAGAAWDEGRTFRDQIAALPEVRERIGDRLDELFDPVRALRNLDVVFDRLTKLQVEDA
jgi:adenylosuccinate lyase